MAPMKGRRRLIIDVGAGDGAFVKELRLRNREAHVVGVDRDPKAKVRTREIMGAATRRLKKPERVKEVWLNHVDIISGDAFKEFKAIVEKLPPGTPVMLTMRKINIEKVRNALNLAGLEIRTEKPWNPQMIGSTYTKKFYERAEQGKELMRPIRIVAIKPR